MPVKTKIAERNARERGQGGALWRCAALVTLAVCACRSSADDAAAGTSGSPPSGALAGAAADGGATAGTSGPLATGGMGGVSPAIDAGVVTSGAASPRAGASAPDASSDAGSTRRDAGATADASATPDAGGTDAGEPAAIAQPSEIHGVNWADARDNFVNGVLQLSGLDSKLDSYETVQAKTTQIVTQFRDTLGANTIRIPINEPTVANAWWDKYKAAIDTTTGLGMNVIVAYWAYHNGKPDNETAFKTMWQKVVSDYAANNRVFFDIHNEPSGFGASWNDEAARWLGYFPDIPRARVIVAGTGSDDNVVPVGSDKRFDGCVLQLHYYAFWHEDWTTQKQWTDAIKKSVGTYAARTIVGEWGAAMSTGLNYMTNKPDGNNSISYITAAADFIRTNHMGSVYWPGLRDGDSYSLMKRASGGNAITLSVVSASGHDRLRWAWGL